MALSFDGSDDSLTHSGAIFSGSSTDYNFSLSAWVKPSERHLGTIIGADAGSGNSGRFSLFSTSSGKFSLRRTASTISQLHNTPTTIRIGFTYWERGSTAVGLCM